MKKDGLHYTSIWPLADRQAVEVIDQTRLPHEFSIASIGSVDAMVVAIKTMQVRGAPLIGAAAAYGIALATLEAGKQTDGDAHIRSSAQKLLDSRPTAVNLRWAVDRMLLALQGIAPADRVDTAWHEAAAICAEDVETNHSIAQHGLGVIRLLVESRSAAGNPVSTQHPLNILTHCNAGWLAAVDWGTALAPIYAAHDAGIAVHVWVDETRPRNQGASLTAWELAQHGVPYTVISDNAGGHLMQHGQVDMVIVGADRVTARGDVCNKIGTYLKALAAYDNGVPFYAAVPSPTIDWGMQDGIAEIHIEERHGDEVRLVTGKLVTDQAESGRIATVNILPDGSPVANPAFDVTPARLVTGIITERGLCGPARLEALFHAPA